MSCRAVARVWHETDERRPCKAGGRGTQGRDLDLCIGAGEENRTLMTSLEGWGSTIELRPRSDGALCRTLPGNGGEDDVDCRDGNWCGLRGRPL
jgi:hypothetical protein